MSVRNQYELLCNNAEERSSQAVSKLNQTHELQICAGYADLFFSNINTVKKRVEALLTVSKDAGLEVNSQKTVSCHKNAGQSKNVKIVKKFYENVAQLKYLGITQIKIA